MEPYIITRPRTSCLEVAKWSLAFQGPSFLGPFWLLNSRRTNPQVALELWAAMPWGPQSWGCWKQKGS